jgi:hypothetical protein
MAVTAADAYPGPEEQLSAARAAEEEWAEQNRVWLDAHAKLNLLRNGGWDDPVKDHDGYLLHGEAPPPVQLWD